MDEMENTGMEMTDPADQQDAFLDGWDDSGAEIAADQPGQDADGEAEDTGAHPEEAAADTGTDEGKAETTAQQQTADGGQQSAEDGEKPETAWVIKHNGTELTVKAGDITPELLQKGVDYDRIRSKYDEAKPVMEMFSGLAKANGMSVQDYIRVVRSAVKKAEGLNDEEARRAIDLEDREAAVSAREAEQQESEAAASRRAHRSILPSGSSPARSPTYTSRQSLTPRLFPKAYGRMSGAACR